MPNLVRALALLIASIAASPVAAQQQDSVFASYAELREFVDTRMMARDFVPVIQTLGGRDEYTTEQLAGINAQFLGIYKSDLENKAMVMREAGENGFRQEVISYWTGVNYLWLYMFLHETGDGVVVVTFAMNSNAEAIISKM